MVGASPYRPYSVSDNTAVLAHMETSDRISRSVQHTCPYFATGSLFCSLVMGLNYLCADKASQHEVRAEITGKWQKKHTRYRHVGRRHHAIPQGSYNTYHIKLEFPDGRTKEMSVSLSEYNRARTGRFRTLEVADGLFWMPVIK